MKTWISFLVLLVSMQAHALDTSGCMFIETAAKPVTTVQLKNILRVSQSMINSDACWDKNDSAVIISYEWIQDSPDTNHKIEFWTKINEQESTVKASVNCQQRNNASLGSDTSGAPLSYKCVATARVRVGYQRSVSVEVAPIKDNTWDVEGYQKNYHFSF